MPKAHHANFSTALPSFIFCSNEAANNLATLKVALSCTTEICMLSLQNAGLSWPWLLHYLLLVRAEWWWWWRSKCTMAMSYVVVVVAHHQRGHSDIFENFIIGSNAFQLVISYHHPYLPTYLLLYEKPVATMEWKKKQKVCRTESISSHQLLLLGEFLPRFTVDCLP